MVFITSNQLEILASQREHDVHQFERFFIIFYINLFS
jgi:hypothetical protein